MRVSRFHLFVVAATALVVLLIGATSASAHGYVIENGSITHDCCGATAHGTIYTQYVHDVLYIKVTLQEWVPGTGWVARTSNDNINYSATQVGAQAHWNCPIGTTEVRSKVHYEVSNNGNLQHQDTYYKDDTSFVCS